MNWGKRISIGLVLAFVTLFVRPRAAQGQWSVVDFSNLAQAIKTFNQLMRIYTATAQTYEMARMMQMTISHPNRMMYMVSGMNAVNDITRSRYGETILWPRVMNGYPAGAPGAWSAATIPMGAVPMNPLTNPGVANNLMARVAQVEITDGSAAKCMQVIAQYRQNKELNRPAEQGLLNTVYDDIGRLNTYASLSNIANMQQAQQHAELASQGDIQTCLVEQQIIANKAERDALVERINYAQGAATVLQDDRYSWNGDIAYQTYRMP